MAAITRMEAQEWANRLRATLRARHRGRPVTGDSADVPALGAEMVAAAVHVMSSLYAAAMNEIPPLVTANPFAGLELPKIRRRPVEFLEHAEADAIYAAARDLGPEWGTLIELGTEVGLRPGEIYGLRGHRVDWLRGRLRVIDVMTRRGLREWPKSTRSNRVVPVPRLMLRACAASRRPGLRPRLKRARVAGSSATARSTRCAVSRPGSCGTPPLWLVQDGVPLYDVQALLGHESYRTTERYAHLRPDAHGRVLESWARRHDACLTHERKEARPS